MKKSKLLSLVTAAFFLFTASVSFAETITVYIIVKVATVDDSDNLLGGSISVEDTITGVVETDSSEEEDYTDVELQAFSVEELKGIADELGVSLSEATEKEEIITLILAN